MSSRWQQCHAICCLYGQGRIQSVYTLCYVGNKLPVSSDFAEGAFSNLTWYLLAPNLSILGLKDKLSDRHHSILIKTLLLQY